MIISQFCRGRFMNNAISVTDDAPTGHIGIPPSVNSQVCHFFELEFNLI